jgi:hypothetical protein
MKPYATEVERHMLALYDSLSEKDRRRYAAVEAEKLGHGGVQYVADLFDCDPETVRHGHLDVEQLPVDDAAGRVRKKGGRNKAVIAQRTAGSPVDEQIRWTSRSPAEIAAEAAAEGFSVCADTVRRILSTTMRPFAEECRKCSCDYRAWCQPEWMRQKVNSLPPVKNFANLANHLLRRRKATMPKLWHGRRGAHGAS